MDNYASYSGEGLDWKPLVRLPRGYIPKKGQYLQADLQL